MSNSLVFNENIVANYEEFEKLLIPQMTAAISNECHYISTKAEYSLRPLTIWVAADFDSQQGRDMLLNAVKYTVSNV